MLNPSKITNLSVVSSPKNLSRTRSYDGSPLGGSEWRPIRLSRIVRGTDGHPCQLEKPGAPFKPTLSVAERVGLSGELSSPSRLRVDDSES